MQKKLLAVAVAGALVAPAAALAQSSTVSIYGQITYEYGIADQGVGKPSSDYADTPGGSAIGFRGEEKLGGNLSAWFQCETSADIRGYDQIGLCSRNSAVGFKGGFGNVFFGRWDTPMKRAMNMGTVGAEETGILGMSFIGFGGSGGAQAILNSPTSDGGSVSNQEGANGETQQRQRFKRREAGLSYYESPSWNGLQVMAAFSAANGTFDNSVTDVQGNQKARIWSLGATYANGPLALGAGYEKHNDFGPINYFGTTGAGANTDVAVANRTSQTDDGWGVSAAYTFGGNIKVGATYLERKWEPIAGLDLKRKSWTIGVDWNISGPHSISAQYAAADDSSGSCTRAARNAARTAFETANGLDAGSSNLSCSIGGNGGATEVGGANGVSDTASQAFSIAYTYAFSKRTSIKLGYVKVDNDNGTNSVRIGNTSAIANGENVDGYAFHIRHRF